MQRGKKIMGDRRLAEIKTEEGSLYFYTHSMGSRLPDDARRALEFASARRGDTPYALRIIVDQLISSSGSRDSHLGSGLMLGPDGEDEYGGDPCSVVIDLMRWTVTTYSARRGRKFEYRVSVGRSAATLLKWPTWAGE